MHQKYTLAEYGKAFTDMESLLDIYVFDTNEHDWNKVLHHLYSGSKYVNIFAIDQQPSPIFTDVKKIFELASNHGVLLRIDKDLLDLNCHFFITEEIEFDLDYRSIDSDDMLTRLLEFIHDIAHLLQKRIVMTPESEEHIHYLSFDPLTNSEIWSLPEWEHR